MRERNILCRARKSRSQFSLCCAGPPGIRWLSFLLARSLYSGAYTKIIKRQVLFLKAREFKKKLYASGTIPQNLNACACIAAHFQKKKNHFERALACALRFLNFSHLTYSHCNGGRDYEKLKLYSNLF